MYVIMGKYRGNAGEIDQFETRKEAMRMFGEYRMAFGSEWVLWIRKKRLMN